MNKKAEQLQHDLNNIAQMAAEDGCDLRVVQLIRESASHVVGGGYSVVSYAAARLSNLRKSAERGFELSRGAETHIALACEAFEKVYGPL